MNCFLFIASFDWVKKTIANETYPSIHTAFIVLSKLLLACFSDYFMTCIAEPSNRAGQWKELPLTQPMPVLPIDHATADGLWLC